MNIAHFSLSTIAMAVISVSMPTFAQDVEPDAAKVAIERVTVTANRKETLDTDLAMSVESVNAQELRLDNGQHVGESLNSLSGVLINQLQGAQGHNAAIRMPINYGGYYLYLQDNIPLQSPAFFNHNALWWSSFNSNVSRMEVLKGAGTALYGSGAVAATVNIISATNSKTPKSNLSIGGGENGYAKLGFSHSQAIDKSQSISVSGSFLTNQGWRSHTSSKRGEITLRHEYQINDNEQLVTSVVLSDLNQEMATNLLEDDFLNDSTVSGLPAAVLAVDPTRKSQYMRLATQWTKQFNNELYVSVIPYYRHRTNDYTATWSANMPKAESNVDSFGLLALTAIDHSDGSDTTMGLDVEVSDGDQLSYQPVTITTSGFGGDTFNQGEQFFNDSTRYIGLSPYIQHQRALTQSLDLTAGLRYDYAGYDFDNHLGIVGDIGHGAQSLADRKDSFNHLSPKAALNYHLNSNSSVYLRYANSFRMPTASSLYHLKNSDSNTAISGVNPELSDTFETGYKVNFDSVTFDVALYSMDVDDAIVTAYDDAGVRYQANAGQVSHKGFEFSSDWQVNKTFDVSFAYTKAKHQYDEFVVDAGRVDGDGNSKAKDYSGNEMRMAPDYITNLRLRYHPGYINGFSSMLEFQSIGDYWMDDPNSRKYSGYTVANLKFYYQFDEHLSFNARIVNLTDKVYAQQAEIRFGKAKFAPGAPRTAYLSMNYQW